MVVWIEKCLGSLIIVVGLGVGMGGGNEHSFMLGVNASIWA